MPPNIKEFRIQKSGVGILCFIFCILNSVFLFFQPTLLAEELARQLLPLLSNPSVQGALVGISVISLPDKTPLFAYNSKELFTLASNTKLFTTAAALDCLGSSYEFKTRLYLRGNVDQEGKLHGDIIIQGGGDPNISGRFNGGKVTAILDDWAEALLKSGIKEIEGDIVADDSFFDEQWVHPEWPKDQLLSWYCAPASALSINDNCVDIILHPGRDGRAKMELEPDSSYIKISNSCRVSDNIRKSHIHICRNPASGELYIRGEIPSAAKTLRYSVPVDKPPLFLVSAFQKVLERKGIKVSGQPRLLGSEKPGQAWQLLTCTTSPMSQTVMVTNTRSQNFYAEQILKTLGAEMKGQGSFSAGLEVIREFMLKLGYEPWEYQSADGSGLCRENRFSPEMITDLLAFMYQHKEKETFISSLPVSGITGSLRKRLREPSSAGKVRAKTGYISKVCALSGYVETRGGNTLAFSILVNDFKAVPANVKEFQDSVCRVLVAYNNEKPKDIVATK
ncbi:MAG TPA: D-alanyl-D-alanine carboxypeptidase/D-alanyl-D-alanine endopeptidase [Candidatus Hypogeohydataceae bacterium YC41]